MWHINVHHGTRCGALARAQHVFEFAIILIRVKMKSSSTISCNTNLIFVAGVKIYLPNGPRKRGKLAKFTPLRCHLSDKTAVQLHSNYMNRSSYEVQLHQHRDYGRWA